MTRRGSTYPYRDTNHLNLDGTYQFSKRIVASCIDWMFCYCNRTSAPKASTKPGTSPIMKIKNLFLTDMFSYVLLTIGCLVLAALFYYQPRISDDWYELWEYQDSKGIIDYWVGHYNSVNGRLPLILLSSLVFPHPAVMGIYRLFIVAEVFVLIGLAWYCALGRYGFRFNGGMFQAFLVFGMLLWLSLPVRSETVSWLSGNFVYLIPGILGLMFIAFSKHCLSDGRTQSDASWVAAILKSPIWFSIGFLAGSSQEQIISACAVFTAANIYREIVARRFKEIPIRYWIAVMGLSLGAVVLVVAPSNVVRLGTIDSPSVLEIVERMLLFVPSAFFEIGTGNTGKSIWFGISILIVLFYKKGSVTDASVSSAGTWIVVSVATLLALLPATNYISPRTSFFAIIFLYIAVASLLFENNIIARQPLVSVILMIIGLLVLVEATAGMISNISVAAEFNRRWSIVYANHSDRVAVPFIATYPGSLTYIQTPEHDRMFLGALSKRVGFKVDHDVDETAPLPVSFMPLKGIKYHQR